MRKQFIFAALVLCGLAGGALAQNPDLVLNPGSSYVDVGRGIPWSSFNRTYVLVPNSPNASVCVYVVNNNPTSAHAFTTTTFQSADSQVADYSNNTGRFSSVPLVNMPASVAASTMGSGFTQSTAAAKVAIKFTGATTQAGSPDTADVFLVQTTSGTCGTASTSNQVQGTTVVGAAALGNPVLVGGVDTNGFAQFLKLCSPVAGSSCSTLNGQSISIGANGNTVISTSGGGNVTWPNPGGGPLGVYSSTASGVTNGQMASPTVGAGGSAGGTTQNLRGQMSTDTGYYQLTSGTISSNTIFSFFAPPGNAAVASCYAEIHVTNNSGTAPTLDAYFQTSIDGTTWNDRIHFAQATTGSSNQYAGITSSVGITPAVIATGALAVSTKIDGPIGYYGRISFVLGGTLPNYSVTAALACK